MQFINKTRSFSLSSVRDCVKMYTLLFARKCTTLLPSCFWYLRTTLFPHKKLFPRSLLHIMSLNSEEWGNSSSFLHLFICWTVSCYLSWPCSHRRAGPVQGSQRGCSLWSRNSNAIFCLKTNRNEKMDHIHLGCSSVLGNGLGLWHFNEAVTHVLHVLLSQLLPLRTPANSTACHFTPDSLDSAEFNLK